MIPSTKVIMSATIVFIFNSLLKVELEPDNVVLNGSSLLKVELQTENVVSPKVLILPV